MIISQVDDQMEQGIFRCALSYFAVFDVYAVYQRVINNPTLFLPYIFDFWNANIGLTSLTIPVLMVSVLMGGGGGVVPHLF